MVSATDPPRPLISIYIVSQLVSTMNIIEQNEEIFTCIGLTCQGVFVKYAIEGKTEGKSRRRRRHKRLLDDVMENESYLILKEGELGRSCWPTLSERGCGSVTR